MAVCAKRIDFSSTNRPLMMGLTVQRTCPLKCRRHPATPRGPWFAANLEMCLARSFRNAVRQTELADEAAKSTAVLIRHSCCARNIAFRFNQNVDHIAALELR